MYFPVDNFTIPPNINGQCGKKNKSFSVGKNKVYCRYSRLSITLFQCNHITLLSLSHFS